MTTSKQLSDRFREVMLSGKLIAFTNYRDQLSQVNYEKAIHKVENLNSISALTYHVNYYISGVLQVLNGGELTIRDKFSFDLPSPLCEDEWSELKTSLFENSEAFAQALETIPEKKWNTAFVDEKYGTYLRNIEGMIEHCYYHLGQIVLIRKLIVKP